MLPPKIGLPLLCSCAALASFGAQGAAPPFVASPLTAEGSFTAGIEGPAVDAAGNVYAVNFERQQTVGRISPDGAGEVFVTLPGSSVGNGIRFDRDGFMYVADYVGHNILKVDVKTRAVSVFAHEPRRLVQFRVDRPGAEWQRWQAR